MTYQHLLEELQKLSQAQHEQNLTVNLSEEDEYMPAWAVGIAVETDVLDEDHIVLVS